MLTWPVSTPMGRLSTFTGAILSLCDQPAFGFTLGEGRRGEERRGEGMGGEERRREERGGEERRGEERGGEGRGWEGRGGVEEHYDGKSNSSLHVPQIHSLITHTQTHYIHICTRTHTHTHSHTTQIHTYLLLEGEVYLLHWLGSVAVL